MDKKQLNVKDILINNGIVILSCDGSLCWCDKTELLQAVATFSNISQT